MIIAISPPEEDVEAMDMIVCCREMRLFLLVYALYYERAQDYGLKSLALHNSHVRKRRSHFTKIIAAIKEHSEEYVLLVITTATHYIVHIILIDVMDRFLFTSTNASLYNFLTK